MFSLIRLRSEIISWIPYSSKQLKPTEQPKRFLHARFALRSVFLFYLFSFFKFSSIVSVAVFSI